TLALRLRLSVVLLGEARNRDDAVVALELDQPDALRGAADGPDVAGRHADDHALLRDDQHLVVLLEVGDADHLAVPIGGGDVDDAVASARLHAVLLDLGALAVAALRHSHERAARAHHLHRDDVVVLAEADPADAVGGAAHGPDVGLGEANSHPAACADEDLAGAVGDTDGNHGVALLNAHRDDAARPRVAELRERGLFHRAPAGPHHHVLVGGELLDGDHRRDPFALLHRDQIGNRLALAARTDVRDLVDLEPVGSPPVGEDHDVGVRRGDEQMRDEVLVARPHAKAALAAAPLVP